MNLNEIRAQIDGLDGELLEILAKRRDLALQAGEAKKSQGKATFDPQREAEILAKKEIQAKKLGLNPEFIKDLYQRIMAESRRAQGEKR